MSIVLQLFEIIIRRRQPQDIDYDIVAAVLGFGALVATNYFITSLQPIYSKPLVYSFTQSTVLAIILYGILKLANKEQRSVQTLTAIFGVTAILQMSTLLIFQVPILSPMTLLLGLWDVYLSMLILKAALECSLLQSVLLTVGYKILVAVILILFFPEFINESFSILEQAQKRA